MKKLTQQILLLTSLLTFSSFASEAKVNLKEHDDQILFATIRSSVHPLPILERIGHQLETRMNRLSQSPRNMVITDQVIHQAAPPTLGRPSISEDQIRRQLSNIRIRAAFRTIRA